MSSVGWRRDNDMKIAVFWGETRERSRIPGNFVPGWRDWDPEAYCGVVCAVKQLYSDIINIIILFLLLLLLLLLVVVVAVVLVLVYYYIILLLLLKSAVTTTYCKVFDLFYIMYNDPWI
jgi:hypothetical protein